MTVVGWFLATILQLSTGWLRVVPIGWLALGFVGLLLPSVVTAFINAPRVLKHVARVLLGVLMVSAIWLFVITDRWWLRGVLVLVYFSVKIPLSRRRDNQNNHILHAQKSLANSGSRVKSLRDP